MRRLRYVRVPILTEEYAIHVYVGATAAINTAAQARIERTCPKHYALEPLSDDFRGIAWNCFPEHCPIVGVSAALSPTDAAATLAHEASHAMDFIIDRTHIEDARGEFRAHGIAAVLRHASPLLRR